MEIVRWKDEETLEVATHGEREREISRNKGHLREERKK
jgi:hypothetical protein